MRPFCIVRRIHNKPTGPMGAEATIPIKSPFTKSSNVLTGNSAQKFISTAKLAIFYDRGKCYVEKVGIKGFEML